MMVLVRERKDKKYLCALTVPLTVQEKRELR
jgi:hypothetical protein